MNHWLPEDLEGEKTKLSSSIIIVECVAVFLGELV